MVRGIRGIRVTAGLWEVLDSRGWTTAWGYRIDADKVAIDDGSNQLREIKY